MPIITLDIPISSIGPWILSLTSWENSYLKSSLWPSRIGKINCSLIFDAKSKVDNWTLFRIEGKIPGKN